MRSIEGRIITLFILFILGIQVVGFISFHSAQESKARFAIDTELATSEQAIQQLLDQHTVKLMEVVSRLVHNNDFVKSVSLEATVDAANAAARGRIESVLSTQSTQLNANAALMIGMDGHILATSSPQMSTQLKRASVALIFGAGQQDYVSAIAVSNHIPLQLIAALLKTPTIDAWVVMAFPLENKFITEIAKTTSLQATILAKSKQYWQVVSSSLSPTEAALLAKNVPGASSSGVKKLELNDTEYSIQTIELARRSGEEVVIVLQGSVSERTASYSKAQVGLILITLICLVIAVSGHITFTKRVSQPLQQLGDVAKRLGRGDYHFPIEVNGGEEIRDLAHAFVSMRDGIAQRENEIRRLAYWDTLTDLPNRAQFTSLLKQAIAATNPVNQFCYVLMMDLDRFKHVNDTMGHSYGDLLLKKVAHRLREALPSSQLATHLARLGGDEFAILLPDSNKEAAQELALTVLALLEHPIILEDQAVDLAGGIGLAGYPEHGEDAETLMSHAEVAMYAAKRNKSGSNFTIYSPEIDQSSQQNLSLLSELRSAAIQQDQLRLYVQPKFSLDKKEVVGVEALVRWMHPTRGFLAPDQFIPFAEQTGVIRLLTRWILDKSAELCADLIARGIDLKISINISTHDLLDQDLPVKFADILSRHRVKTSSFCLEITESAIMNDPHRAHVTLDRLNSMGVELSIDDFGTGYSSLSYLKRLPVRELKIDKSFVMHMADDGDDRKIVKSTIDLGHNMGLRVVAEGVMDAAVMTLLTKMGCDQVQGNYINPAIPAEQLVEWLEQKETLLFS